MREHRIRLQPAPVGATFVPLGAQPSKQARPLRSTSGRVAEWLKAPDSKSGVRVTVPGVRIPPLPPRKPFSRALRIILTTPLQLALQALPLDSPGELQSRRGSESAVFLYLAATLATLPDSAPTFGDAHATTCKYDGFAFRPIEFGLNNSRASGGRQITRRRFCIPLHCSILEVSLEVKGMSSPPFQVPIAGARRQLPMAQRLGSALFKGCHLGNQSPLAFHRVK